MKWFKSKNTELSLVDKKVKVIDDELSKLHDKIKEQKMLQQYDEMMNTYSKMVVLIERRTELKPMSITERLSYKALQKLSGEVDKKVRVAVEEHLDKQLDKVE